MKAAFLLAHTSAGWHLLAADSDATAIAVQFKQVKVAGFADVAGEAADRILYFDTGGKMRRKDLDPASAVAGREAAARAAREHAVAEAERLRVGAEELAARLKAKRLAEKAVSVIADGIHGSSQEPEPAEAPAAVSAPAPVASPAEPAAVSAPAPAPAAVVASPAPAPAASADEEVDETRAHFGGGAATPAGPGSGSKRGR